MNVLALRIGPSKRFFFVGKTFFIRGYNATKVKKYVSRPLYLNLDICIIENGNEINQ